jgi:hypothetical protein
MIFWRNLKQKTKYKKACMGPPPRGVGWETPISGQLTQQLELRMVNVMYGSTSTWNWLETLSDF